MYMQCSVGTRGLLLELVQYMDGVEEVRLLNQEV